MNCVHFWCHRWSSRLDYAKLLIFFWLCLSWQTTRPKETPKNILFCNMVSLQLCCHSSKLCHCIYMGPLPDMENVSNTNICSCEPSTSILPCHKNSNSRWPLKQNDQHLITQRLYDQFLCVEFIPKSTHTPQSIILWPPYAALFKEL